jgi:L-lactate utilization protein LutC
MERTAFLERIRQRLGDSPGPELPDSFPPTPASGRAEDLADRFAVQLAKAGGAARLVARGDVAPAVTDVVREDMSGDGVVLGGDLGPFLETIESSLRDAGMKARRPTPETWRDEAGRAAWGVTSARLGVAATGSILMVPGRDSRRVASLLPAAHLAVLPVEQLVPGLEEALEIIAGLGASSSAPVLITGPSRTTDIEMTTVMGVHGPRILRVLLVL